MNGYVELEKIFRKALVLRSVASLLRWDAEVVMPSKSQTLRAEQQATLQNIIQEIIFSPKTARLLKSHDQNEALDEWQSRNLALMRHQFKRLSAIPPLLFQKLNSQYRIAEMAWHDAKKNADYTIFEPEFNKLFKLVKEKAKRWADVFNLAPFEAMMDEHDPGRSQFEVDKLLNETKILFPDIIAQAQTKNPILPKEQVRYSKRQQYALCRDLLHLLHFPMEEGRLDESVHPFTEGVAQDIRITTIFDRGNPLNTIMGLMHELGHALYDNALPKQHLFQLVGQDCGMVVHEAMALFWEKIIGSSRSFTKLLSTYLQRHFGADEIWTSDNIYARLTEVNPAKIRIETDEVSYLGHIILRYEVEKALFNGDITTRDIPAFWQEHTQTLLGVKLINAGVDCLQDIHWAQGYFGYFQAYGLGFIFAAQIHAFLLKTHPFLFHDMEEGNFVPLLNWLSEHIFEWGSLQTASEMILRITKKELHCEPYIHYLKNKYMP